MPDTLKNKLTADMKSALKNKDSLALSALKLVYADCKNKEIACGQSLSDAQVVSILKKQIKHYQESLAQFQKLNRTDSVQEQKKRIELIQAYLPKALSPEELQKIVESTIVELKADSVKHLGLVIKKVQSKTGGLAEDRLLAQMVKERLT